MTDMAPDGVGQVAATHETWVGPPLDEEERSEMVEVSGLIKVSECYAPNIPEVAAGQTLDFVFQGWSSTRVGPYIQPHERSYVAFAWQIL